jgi:hypothetical protein
MKVTIEHKNSGINKNRYKIYDKFIKLLNQYFPLEDDVTITFLGKRTGTMTTGSRLPNQIKVLCENRMTRDIFRTLAHEWVHEHQMSILGRKIGPDIGGENEDDANAYAGQLIKIFEKKFPDYSESMYE